MIVKKSTGMSPYQRVYGTDAIFPTSLGVSVMKLIQEVQFEDDDMTRKIHQTIHLQQTKEEVYIIAQQLQEQHQEAVWKKNQGK